MKGFCDNTECQKYGEFQPIGYITLKEEFWDDEDGCGDGRWWCIDCQVRDRGMIFRG